MRSFFPACCLALLCAAAFAAVGDENWGEEIVLLPPDNYNEISDFLGRSDDIRADGTGRVWVLYKSQYGHRQLATWEQGQWRGVSLLPDRVSEAALLDGPDGSVACVWNSGALQIKGLRARRHTGELPPRNGLQIFGDAAGRYWAYVPARSAAIQAAFPAESAPEFSASLPEEGLNGLNAPMVLPAFRDAAGRYWFAMRSDFPGDWGTPTLVGVYPESAPPAERPACQTRDGLEFPRANILLVGPSGELRRFPGKPQNPQWQNPSQQVNTGTLFTTSSGNLFLSNRGIGFWSVRTEPLCAQQEYPPDMTLEYGPDMRMNVNAVIDSKGGALVGTDAGVFLLGADGTWTARAAGECRGLFAGEGGVWAAFSTDSHIGLPVLVFLPDDEGAPVSFSTPCGLEVISIDMCWPAPDGGIVALDRERIRVQTVSREDLARLLKEQPTAQAAMDGVEFFSTSSFLIGPDGRAYVAETIPNWETRLHVWDGGGWNTISLAKIPAELQNIVPGNPGHPLDTASKVFLDKKGNLWTLGSGMESPAFLVDMSTGKSSRALSFLKLLEWQARSSGGFVAAPPGYSLPLLCADGRIAAAEYSTLHCFMDGTWRKFDASELEVERFGQKSAVYLDDQDRICVLSGEVLQVLAPGERFFKRMPPPANAATIAPAPRPERQYTRPSFALLNELVESRADNYYSLIDWPFTNDLGMTWTVRDGALVCSAHGLESVVFSASHSSPFHTWARFINVQRSALGGVFVQLSFERLLFLPAAPFSFPADTRAALSQDGEGRQVLAFSTEGEGLRHAWRVDRGPWQATEQAEAVVGVLSPGPHLVEVYAFDTQLNADTTPASFFLGAAPEAAEEAPAAPAFPLEVAEVVSAPLVAPDGGVYVLARNEARETLLRRWDGKEWREQPAGGAPEQPDTPPEDLFIPSRVEPDELALADDGRVWVYEGGFPQRGFILSFADGAREYFRFLRERLEDPAARPASFRPAEGRHTAPVLCPDGRVALRMGLRLFCLENGAWRGFRLDTLDKRPVFPWEPFPLGVDGQGRLRVEKAGVCFTLAAGAAPGGGVRL